jgi:predicted dehydrogenase
MAVRWGILGCGDVTEVKSGPGFQRAHDSALTAVMRRDRAKAEDYASRHGVPRAYDRAAALIEDREVDAIYVATPPSTHLELALMAAAAGKPCLVEKPMAMTHAECVAMIDAFRARGVPLWVAYYRRALPRFLAVRERIAAGAIGTLTSIHVQVTERLAAGGVLANWRFDRAVSGGGLFLDLASHCFDLLDFIAGPIADARGFASNTGGAYAVEDVTAAAFVFQSGVVGTGSEFQRADKTDAFASPASLRQITTPVR